MPLATLAAPATDFWQQRSSPEWSARLIDYWRGVGQPHRVALVNQLHHLPRFHSVLEVGCCVGTNLRLVADAFPWVTLCGTDVNADAVAFAQAHFPEADITLGNLLDDVPLPSADLVLSCYCLAYVPPAAIADVLRRIVQAARVAVALAEPLAHHGSLRRGATTIEETTALGTITTHVHALSSALASAVTACGRHAQIVGKTLAPAVQHLDGLVMAVFTG